MQARLPEIDALQRAVEQCQQQFSALEAKATQASQIGQGKQKELEGLLAKAEARVCLVPPFIEEEWLLVRMLDSFLCNA